MGPLLIVFSPKTIEALLLRTQAARRWLGRCFLQGSMHPFMPSILLRSSRLNSFQTYAQTYPPYCQWAQPAQAQAGKGRTVVRTDGPRQAMFTKRLDEQWFHARKSCGFTQ